jgi:hypothetical protein
MNMSKKLKPIRRESTRAALDKVPRRQARATEPKGNRQEAIPRERGDLKEKTGAGTKAGAAGTEAEQELVRTVQAPAPPAIPENLVVPPPPNPPGAVDMDRQAAAPQSGGEAGAPSLGGTPSSPAAADGLREAIARATLIESRVRPERPQDRSDRERTELHEILDTIIGHLANQTRQLGTQQDELSHFRSQLADLEGSVNSHRTGR